VTEGDDSAESDNSSEFAGFSDPKTRLKKRLRVLIRLGLIRQSC